MADPRPLCEETTREGATCAKPIQWHGTCDYEHRHQQADEHEPPQYHAGALEWN